MNNSDLPDDTNTARVPGSRLSRISRLGALATTVAGGMLAEGTRQLAQGKRPKASDLLLTPANARRVADQLAQLRGAAMKVGQLMSMDAGDMLPPELTEILARLRSDARAMPLSQLSQILESNWGKGWNTRFRQFSFQPLAAASIGQVHSAHTKDGRHLALKIQYPAIRESIDSDVENVATLLRISGLIPKHLNIRPLLDEAKLQLHAEADYAREAQWLRRYQALLSGSEHFTLPEVHDDFCTPDILAMSFVEGVPVESMINAAQEDRDRIAHLLIELMFREIFEFRLIQTDPNFANYLYNEATRRLVLLDFGATRMYSETVAEAYRHLMSGAVHNDRGRIMAAAESIGFFGEYIRPEQREAVVDVFVQACEPLCHQGAYDFGNTQLASRIRDTGMKLSMEKEYWHTPPVDAVFLHRKLGGMYLLAARLKARVDINALFRPYLD
ncbi:MAG: AarF/ABC1/UbiB kinase family protein [Thiolinea sp.]